MTNRTSMNLRCWIFVAVACLGVANLALAQSVTKHFDLKGPDLAAALESFGQQSDKEILFSREQTRNIKAPVIFGDYTPEVALQKLLVGTGLTARQVNADTFVVEAEQQHSTRATRIAAADTVAAAQAEAAPTPSTGGISSPSDTAGTIDEIVVTAQRRKERQVDVPISITALNAEQLTTANVQDLGDISKLTPSLRFDNPPFYQPSIRGIGTAVTQAGGGSNVGIYLDGFYSPNPMAADFQLLGVTDIQVLKGPQGTLFGHNTTGGAILVTTADPSRDESADAKVSYGRYDTQQYQGYVTFPIGDRAAMDFEALDRRGNGFVTNIIGNSDTVAGYDAWTVRTGLKVALTDDISVLVRLTHAQDNDPFPNLTNSDTDTTIDPTTGKPWGVTTFTPPGLYTTNPNQVADALPRFMRSHSNIAQVRVNADLGFADLTSYSQWREESVDQSTNLDQIGVTILELGVPVVDTTYSQEFLVTSKPGPALQWTAGAFFFSNRDQWTIDLDNFIETTGRIFLSSSEVTTKNYAVYLDSTYELTPKLFITAGARVAHDVVDNVEFNTGRFVPGIDSNRVTPRAVVRYKTTDNSSVYASYSMGYKAAIIDSGGTCIEPPNYQCVPVKPETVNAFEVGYKYSQNQLSLESAAFYYDYKDLQVSEFLDSATAAIVNAARSRIFGLEGHARYGLGDHILLDAGASWTHARYVTFGTVVNGAVVGAPIYASCPQNGASLPAKYTGDCSPGSYDYVNTDTILHDAPMQHTPAFTGTFGPRYTTGMMGSGEYSLSGNYYYTSKFYFSPSGTQFLQPGYGTLELRAQWVHPSQKFSFAVYGDNVTNQRYRTNVQYNGYGIGAAWNYPVTWGVEITGKL